MRALWKTLAGDLGNVSVVALLLAVEAVLVHFGYARDAAFAVPVLALAGVAWLAVR